MTRFDISAPSAVEGEQQIGRQPGLHDLNAVGSGGVQRFIADWSTHRPSLRVRTRGWLLGIAGRAVRRLKAGRRTALRRTLQKAARALSDAEIPFALAGGAARWVRGGPEPTHDVDFLVKPEDARRALDALTRIGLRAGGFGQWGLEVWAGRIRVDLICSLAEPMGPLVTDAMIEAGDELVVGGMPMRVQRLEDEFVSKLLAIRETAPDYTKVLGAARCLHDQVDWAEVRARTSDSLFATAFFTVADGLGITTHGRRENKPVPIELVDVATRRAGS